MKHLDSFLKVFYDNQRVPPNCEDGVCKTIDIDLILKIFLKNKLHVHINR